VQHVHRWHHSHSTVGSITLGPPDTKALFHATLLHKRLQGVCLGPLGTAAATAIAAVAIAAVASAAAAIAAAATAAVVGAVGSGHVKTLLPLPHEVLIHSQNKLQQQVEEQQDLRVASGAEVHCLLPSKLLIRQLVAFGKT
jgi:hypothetical protein